VMWLNYRTACIQIVLGDGQTDRQAWTGFTLSTFVDDARRRFAARKRVADWLQSIMLSIPYRFSVWVFRTSLCYVTDSWNDLM